MQPTPAPGGAPHTHQLPTPDRQILLLSPSDGIVIYRARNPILSIYDDIYRIVKQVPRGAVCSYGRIARMAGCGARQVGYAMAATPRDEGIPWHRIINSQGKISCRRAGDGHSEQRQLLLGEGVCFDRHSRIDFERFGWQINPYEHLPDDW